MNIKCFSFFGIIILLFAFNSQSTAQLLEKKEFRLKTSDGSFLLNSEIQKQNSTFAPVTSKKNLFLAGVFSFIVPGAALGQFYKEEFVNWGIRAGISAISIVWFLSSPNFDVGGGGDATQKLIAVSIYAVNWIASIIDASIPTKYGSNNKYRKYKSGL